MTGERRAQTVVWGLLGLMVLALLAGGLLDLYRLFSARSWAYSVAQEAALIAASRARRWDLLLAGGSIELDGEVAAREAEGVIALSMSMRGVLDYLALVRVLPGPTGGSLEGFPPHAVRLGESLGDWSSSEPAVGVYLEVPVRWMLLDVFGIEEKRVRVFAAAGVAP